VRAEEVATVIVGAGPAGLAVGACLRRAALPFVILDHGAAVGSSWRGRYRRLHLHTAKEYSGLPYLPFPRQHPRYPSREQVIEYLELYSRHFELVPRLGQAVQAVRHADGGRWLTITRDGPLESAQVVLCTGKSGLPVRPRWPGLETFRGEILHSAQYDSGERFAGKRVLVVGLGNSGAEIAVDLVEHGATVELSVRSPINIVPRDILGMPVQRSTILMRFLPLFLRDAIARLVSRLYFGDLRALGLRRSAQGPISQIVRRGRIPVIDVGTVALLRAGKLRVLPDITRFEGEAVHFSAGEPRPFDALVLATGYRPAVASLLPDDPGATDDEGSPSAVVYPPRPGLYFVGYDNPPTGLLRQIAIESRRVTARIAQRARRASSSAQRA
jgi:indole-3-pyruvate monooxygenase